MRALPCAFATLFHQPCPGCGSTRAVYALLAGDFGALLRFNPLGPVAALLTFVAGVQAVVLTLLDGDLHRFGEGPVGRTTKRALMAVAALEVVVWIARFFGFLGGPVPV